MVADSHLIMALSYLHAVRAFVFSVILCGHVHTLGYPLVAGYMLLATGCIGMATTAGSTAGYIDVYGRDGTVIPPVQLLTRAGGRSVVTGTL